jgi:2-oxoglutarate dehydrogenase E1 component
MTRQPLNDRFLRTSFLSGANAAYVEEMQAQYERNPGSVGDEWRHFFESLNEERKKIPGDGRGPSWGREIETENGELVAALTGDYGAEERNLRDNLQQRAHMLGFEMSPAASLRATQDSIRALMLIRAYRVMGHLAADLDPLGLADRKVHRELKPETYGFTDADLDRPIFIDRMLGLETATMRQILRILRRTYCRHIGVQFMHITSPAQKAWIQDRIEGEEKDIRFTPEGRRAILNKLIETEAFEKFCEVKYTGTKRFGIDGAESMAPALEQIIKRGGQLGVKGIVIGMAHRGRLNVLANVMEKPASQIFAEFIDKEGTPDEAGGGDVKYHLGYSIDRVFGSDGDAKRVHLSMTFNPSHLEWVNTVVQGRVRAKQDRTGDTGRSRCLPLLIHGDAAFAGQGIIAEAFNMSELDGYRVGGTVHVVVNNQIGFTTSPRSGYSTTYCTDVARMLQIPIFHVNGEDPEAVAQVVDLAVDFRQRFHRDALIELWCYRKHGHNEADEPSYTQPQMYRAIAAKPSIRTSYVEAFAAMPGSDAQPPITMADADAFASEKRDELEAELEVAGKLEKAPRPSTFAGAWARVRGGAETKVPLVPTAVTPEIIKLVGHVLGEVPAGFHVHPRLKIVKDRAAMAAGEKPIDWGMGEALAFGTLLNLGIRVRVSGQDVRRGTFSHRHSVLFDFETGAEYTPLAHIRDKQGVFEVHDSPLSEAGVLGFEYGYSLDMPEGLTIWEAQFGDFVNAAQVIIDQFLCSSEAKWNRVSGLVMLLPHGMEGQGPEHSSARLERFLNMCVNDNLQVCNLTTPAQYFHVLRRQVLRPYRKPLVIMSPKSLLRHPAASSALSDFTDGGFQRIIPDQMNVDPSTVKRVLLCTGKVYYDLLATREEKHYDDVAIIRIEQLYPMHKDELLDVLSVYPDGTPVVWVQEEARNMGAWAYMNRELPALLAGIFPWSCVSRPLSASPATGSMTRHKREQARVITDAFGKGSA